MYNFTQQELTNGLHQPVKRTAYGVVTLPDGRILLKRSLFKSSSTRFICGLWHATLNKQAVKHSALSSLKSVLFDELGIRVSENNVNIQLLETKELNNIYGELVVHSIHFKDKISIKLSPKLEVKAMWMHNLLEHISTEAAAYMPECKVAIALFKNYARLKNT